MTTRRNFLKAAAVAAATPYFALPKARAESDTGRLRMAAIGCGGQGRLDMSYFDKLVDIVALCDVDSKFGIAETLWCGYGRKEGDKVIQPDTYSDYRRVLERDDIDAVLIATPDHWHTKIAIEAMQAGKHVFCEKPLTLTLEENRLIREAVHKYNCVFQVGTMQRCFTESFMLAALIIRGGYLGKIKKAVIDIGGCPTSPAIPKAPVALTPADKGEEQLSLL